MNFDNHDTDNGDDDRKRDSSRKREGKREKKEKGYQVFEEEDSEEEQLMLAEDMKSPSKQKKEKAKPTFKFPVRKEKTKDKEEKKDKEAKKEEKEKKREEKGGKKLKKDKKKSKHAPAPAIAEPSQYENPIFGVPLALAVERNKSHDGIELPAIVRECIDYIEECGLACEGIYRISGVKSKVQHLKDCYNRHEQVYLCEHEPNVVASLLKQFLRDLPEPVLTTALMPKFEEASVIKSNKKKTEAFIRLIGDLPTCNRLLLSWMIVHMTHVIELAKENKMTLQNVSIVLSPTMQISHRVLNILFSNVNTLFAGLTLRKYVPPLKPAHSKWSLELPDNPTALEEELAKQESLLNQLHADLNSGLTDPEIEEQLWEVQRVVTQLKRKIKMAKKNTEVGERRKSNIESKKSSTTSLPSLSAPEELQLQLRTAPEPGPNVTTVTAVVEKQPQTTEETPPSEEGDEVKEAKKGVKFAVEPQGEKVENKPEQVVEDSRVEVEKEVSEVKAAGQKEESKEAGEERAKEVPVPVKKESESSAEVLAEKDKVSEEKSEDIESETTMKETVKVEEVVVKSNEQEPKAEEVKKEKEQPEPAESKAPQVEEAKSVKKSKAPPIPSQDTTQTQAPSAPSQEQASPEQNLEAKTTPAVQKVELEPAPVVVKPPEVKIAPIPPFMSTVLLQPMKAEPPKPKPVVKHEKEDSENLTQSEKLRELEEELLGEKKKKVAPPKEKEEKAETVEDDDDLSIDTEQLMEEEYALMLEEEELLAIADELRQKIATERGEMERLTQEIQELQYLRQDSDLEDLSSSSSSSEDSEDEEDLQDLLAQLIQENQDLETKNADFCNKIHEERMICLSVKLQIRLLQQKQLEASYG